MIWKASSAEKGDVFPFPSLDGQPGIYLHLCYVDVRIPLAPLTVLIPRVEAKHNPGVASNSHPGTPLLRWHPTYVRSRASLLRKCGGDHGSDDH